MAGAVTVETAINDHGSRAYIDVPRGAELPGDVPQEQLDRLVVLGDIASDDSQPVSADESEDGRDASKDELIALAESEGVEVDKRWSAKRIQTAIDEARE